ncbi:MAG: TonB-dependent receptor plug domain-containing protein, partial [Bacteroidetes bacterium]|nr:TonB-dependent receptor plug domain-containing protein [Bacteroidota bacterium]
MKYRATIIISFFICCFTISAILPPEETNLPWIKSLLERLNYYQTNYQAEKIYLHTDRTFYKPGESIWFSAYLIDPMKPAFQAESQIIYVDLINPKGKVEKQLRLHVKDFHTNGDFLLGQDAPGGIYRLKAYTNLMREDNVLPFEKELQVQNIVYPNILMKLDFDLEAYGPGDEVIADIELRNLKDEPLSNLGFKFVAQINGKDLEIGKNMTDAEGKATVRFELPSNLQSNDGILNVMVDESGFTESVSRSIPIVLHHIDLQFFPEGGEMISGVKTQLAFKALNEFGKPADVSGIILDQKGKKVADFQSFHMGMGVFDFTPEKGETYSAQILKPVKSEKTYPLPEALSNGYQLNIHSQTRDYIDFSIYSSASEVVVLMGQSGGKIYEAHQVKCKKDKNYYRIPLKEFPAGVAQFTLFNRVGEPQAERLAFVNSHKQLTVEISTDKVNYLPREKIEVSIKVTDESGNPAPAQFSLAVVDDKNISFADDKQAHIMSSLLLSAELKGDIEEPNFYFDPEEPKAKPALDLVMMTHGWRRFQWQDIQKLSVDLPRNQKPEMLGEISGWILDQKDEPVPHAEIIVFEMAPVWQTRYVRADKYGYFQLGNMNGQSVSMQARTASGKTAKIMIPQSVYELISQGILQNKIAFPLTKEQKQELEKRRDEKILAEIQEIRKKQAENSPVESKKPLETRKVYDASPENIDMVQLDWDGENLALEEVVVVGYGTEKRSSIYASIINTGAEYANLTSVNGDFMQLLPGKIPGLEVAEFSGAPGAPARLWVRGAASMQNNTNPLFIVDGVPIGNNLDVTGTHGMNPVSMIPPDDISQIQIIRGPESTAIYGSRGANGVIVITTKHPNENLYGKVKDREPEVFSFYYPNQLISSARQFYVPQYSGEPAERRTDFRTTVYWNPAVKIDNTGEGKISFFNSDATTAFRIIAEGMNNEAVLGRAEKTYSVQMPFSLNSKIPAVLTSGDKFLLPVTLTNNTDQPINGNISFTLPENLIHSSSRKNIYSEPVELTANQSTTLYYETLVLDKPGEGELVMRFRSAGFHDEFTQKVSSVSRGFERMASISGKELNNQKKVKIQNLVKGSLTATFTAYPDGVSELMEGVAAILREPHGCFEQTSSSTYPNVLALNLMEDLDYDQPEVRKKARSLISKGYDRLIGFETSEKGYEWFGSTPAHSALSAYGLVEFQDMSKVYAQVDQTMIQRTRHYLLGRRTGKGGFKADGRGLDTFGHADQDIADAYITNALAQAGEKSIDIELDYTYESAKQSEDPYIMALAAHSLLIAGDKTKGEELLEMLYTKQAPGGGWVGKKHSVTRSTGNSLSVETTSIAILAMLKSDNTREDVLTKAVNYLVSQRSGGWFASTQGTIQALRALSEYMKRYYEEGEDGKIEISINGKKIASQMYAANSPQPIKIQGLEKYLGEGEFDIKIQFADTEKALPYSLDINWKVDVPPSDSRTVVDLRTEMV